MPFYFDGEKNIYKPITVALRIDLNIIIIVDW
jgi:hypothetical protein